MQLFILLTLCWLTASLEATPRDVQKPVDAPFQPRYQLLSESKKKEQDLEQETTDLTPSEHPWRRLSYSGLGSHQGSWSGSSPGALLGPGLMLLGVNLGALLYMLLGVLGLAPPPRLGVWHNQDIYRNDRQHLGGGKELDLYL